MTSRTLTAATQRCWALPRSSAEQLVLQWSGPAHHICHVLYSFAEHESVGREVSKACIDGATMPARFKGLSHLVLPAGDTILAPNLLCAQAQNAARFEAAQDVEQPSRQCLNNSFPEIVQVSTDATNLQRNYTTFQKGILVIGHIAE
eukprot:2036174-Amphidinium_carterae.1